jgi:caffeoyl-CoA O-methyltransferase
MSRYFTDAKIWQYCLEHTTGLSDLLIQLEQQTQLSSHGADMLSGKMVAKIIQFFLRLKHPKLCVDIGTYTGFSALAMAESTSPETIIYTIDRKEQPACEIAKKYIDTHYPNKIKQYRDSAEKIIPLLPNHIDFVFIDADKKNTRLYFDLLLPKLNPHALIIVDDVLWRGEVVLSDSVDKRAQALNDFNQYIFNHPACDNMILPVRHGLNVIYYNGS